MAQYTAFETVGKKEDVSDIISTLTPTRTPFTSSIGTEKVNNVLFQWQEDSLAAVRVNAQVEGFTAADATLAPTQMRQNYTQILEKTIKTSGTVDAVDHYGRAKESAYQMAKAMSEVKRDLEHAFVGIDAAAVAGSSAAARRFATVFKQIDAAMRVVTGGANTALSEANLLTALQRAYNEGAEVNTVMVTPDDSITISDFAKASGRNRDIATGTKIVNAVDLYVSPFGQVAVQLNRFLLAGRTLVYDKANWKKVILRDWFRETLAKDGDNTKQMVVGEFSLKHVNFKASAVIERAAA